MRVLKASILILTIIFLIGCAHKGYVPLDDTSIDPQKRKQYYTAKKEMKQKVVPDIIYVHDKKLRNIKPKTKKDKAKQAKELGWEKWPPKKDRFWYLKEIAGIFKRKKNRDSEEESEKGN